ncbi:glutathione S-transferase family protein [Salinivibrio sp. IB574]|uniref:glutathione S-transferase family protein n=1 Tax=Salinivibrio sp. IB574 TaxID=1909444 RepID=UPI0009889990|nr:glutathione S-transferase family protein [Salinivibrio sp. IB574]
MMVLHGDSLSPQTRKIALALRFKRLNYELVPASPFEAHEVVLRHPPMQTIVALLDGGHTIYHDTIVAEYLDDAYPDPLLYPGNARHRADIRWIEWYCCHHLSPLIVDTLFYQRVVRGHMLEKDIDHQAVNDALKTLPEACQYLSQLLTHIPADKVNMATISVWSLFRCAQMAGLVLDSSYTQLNQYLEALSQHPLFGDYAQEENHQLTPFFASPISLSAPND